MELSLTGHSQWKKSHARQGKEFPSKFLKNTSKFLKIHSLEKVNYEIFELQADKKTYS